MLTSPNPLKGKRRQDSERPKEPIALCRHHRGCQWLCAPACPTLFMWSCSHHGKTKMKQDQASSIFSLLDVKLTAYFGHLCALRNSLNIQREKNPVKEPTNKQKAAGPSFSFLTPFCRCKNQGSCPLANEWNQSGREIHLPRLQFP